MGGPVAENVYDVIVIGIGPVGHTVAGQVPIGRLWHAVPCFPTISEVWLRLLEAYRD
jgi:pyruvate/2-oxoglutarate dehydrogenase complex dihydrolipoamide dehydrogenase (E3) component